MQSLFSVNGKTALVTGGSKGIGFMIARGLVEAGAKVYISARKKPVCDDASAELSRLGTCISLPADLSRMDEIDRVVVELSQREEKLDILINNAGATWGAPLADFPENGWDKVLDLNLKSVFFLTQKLLPLLLKSAQATDPARVINIGSIDGINPPSLEFKSFSYGASKAGVHYLTRMLAKHLTPQFVTVNCIAPGPFETPMLKPMIDRLGDEIAKDVPLGRMGEGDDIAGVALMLCSRAGAFVSGVVLPVDGGRSATV